MLWILVAAACEQAENGKLRDNEKDGIVTNRVDSTVLGSMKGVVQKASRTGTLGKMW